MAKTRNQWTVEGKDGRGGSIAIVWLRILGGKLGPDTSAATKL